MTNDRRGVRFGRRGEWLVAIQVVLMALVFLGPPTLAGRGRLLLPFPLAWQFAGTALVLAGVGLLGAGIVALGRSLTPLPYPKADATLVESGPYAVVRHPMYGGGILLGLGWALCVRSWLTLGYVAVLFVFLDGKSRREERWLAAKFSGYESYRRRVRRLVPFLY